MVRSLSLTFSPLAPPRFQLVAEPGGLQCAGVVEFYSGGLGGTIGIEPQNEIKDLGQLICAEWLSLEAQRDSGTCPGSHSFQAAEL